ncbi:MAG: LolA family protein, partial [Candidatus Kapaibacteriota bacterium]
LAKEINSQLGSNLVLHLRLKEDSAQNVKIYLDSKLQIKAIAFSNGRESAIYQIKKINLNVKTTSSTFDFSPPKDTEVIDLR